MKVGPGSGEGVPVRGDETSHPNHPQGANPSAGGAGAIRERPGGMRPSGHGDAVGRPGSGADGPRNQGRRWNSIVFGQVPFVGHGWVRSVESDGERLRQRSVARFR